MAENGTNTEEGAKLTTEQLLTELGKLVFAISKQLGTVVQKLESLDKTLAEGIYGKLESMDRALGTEAFAKLDRLAELQEAGNAKLEAVPGAIEATGKKIDAVEGKAESIDKSVKSLTDKTVKELKNVVSASKDLGKDLTKAITDLDSRMASGFADGISGVNQGLKPLEEAVSALMTQTGSVVESVKNQTGEVVRLADVPSPVHPDLITKLDELTEEVRKSTESLSEKYSAETSRLIENPPHPDLVSKLDGILEQARTSGDALDGNLQKTAEGIVSAIGSSDDSRRALLEEKFVDISERMNVFPESVNQLGETLTGKIEEFRTDAGKLLEDASASLEKSSSTLDTVEKIVTETKQEQGETLGRMMELVERHRENADEDEVERLNSLAIRHYNNSEYSLAQDCVEKALMLGANKAELWSNLAHIKAAAEDLSGAEEAFRKALQLEPELDQAISGLGVLMVDTGRPQETIEFLREFLMEESPSVRTMMAYSKALGATGRHSDALQILARARELAPGNPEVEAEIARYSDSGAVPPPDQAVQSNIQGVIEETAPEPVQEEAPAPIPVAAPEPAPETAPEAAPEPAPGADTDQAPESEAETEAVSVISTSEEIFGGVTAPGDSGTPFGGGTGNGSPPEEDFIPEIITENVLISDPLKETDEEPEDEAEPGS